MASSTIAADELNTQTDRDAALAPNSNPTSTSLFDNFPAIVAFAVIGGVFFLAIVAVAFRMCRKSTKKKKYLSQAEKEYADTEASRRHSTRRDSMNVPVVNERVSDYSRASTGRYGRPGKARDPHTSFNFPPPPARPPPVAAISAYKDIENSPFYGPVSSPVLQGFNGNDHIEIPRLTLDSSEMEARYHNECACGLRCWMDEPDKFATLINFNAEYPTNPVAMPVTLPLDTSWESFPHNLLEQLLFSEYRILHVFQISDRGFKCLAESINASLSKKGSKYYELLFMKNRCEFERVCTMLRYAAGESVQGDVSIHDNQTRIVQLHSAYLATIGNEEHYVVVTPHYITNLYAYLQHNPPTSRHTRKLLLEDLTRCLYSLHRKGIAHGKIDPSAFVKDLETGDGFGGWKLLLDVNAAKVVSNGDIGAIGNPIRDSAATGPTSGSSATFEADVWAVGCVAFEIYTGMKYDPANTSTIQQELCGIQAMDPGAYDILIQMLNPDHNSRITLHGVIERASKRISKFMTGAEITSMPNVGAGGASDDNESVVGWWDAAIDLPYWDSDVERLCGEERGKLEDRARGKQRRKRHAIRDGSPRMLPFGIEQDEVLKRGDGRTEIQPRYSVLDVYTNPERCSMKTAKAGSKPTTNSRNGSSRSDTSSQEFTGPMLAKSVPKFSMPSQTTSTSSRAAATTATNLIIDAAAHGLDPRAVMAAVSQQGGGGQNSTGKGGQVNALARERLQDIREHLMNARDHKLPRYYAVLASAECQGFGKKMKRPRTWDSHTFRLHILCEGLGPAHIHHEVHFTRHAGYQIMNPQSFIQWTAPALSLAMKSLSAAMVASGSVQSIDLPEGFVNWLESEGQGVRPVRWFEWMARVLSGYAVGAGNGNSGSELEGNLVEAMIEIEAFLYRNSHDECGNLRPVMMADGEIRWLCRQHVEMCSAAAEAMNRVCPEERRV